MADTGNSRVWEEYPCRNICCWFSVNHEAPSGSGDYPQMQNDLLPHSGMFQYGILHVMSSKISMNFLHLTWRIYFNIYEIITFIKNLKACIYSKNMRLSEIHRLVFHPYPVYSSSVSRSEYSDTYIARGHQEFPLGHLFFGDVSDVDNTHSYIKTTRWRLSQRPSTDLKSKPMSACT